ncbi:MAG: hypothetical protein IT581_14810 [Verrucomicrobiales bacterium]|nr:hypothetical protein [Verrucomicrobiales bacterium]
MRNSNEGQGDAFDIDINSLDGPPGNITVTASSSNPSVFDTSDLTVTTNPAIPTRRTVVLRKGKRGSGQTTVTLTLNPGGGGPVGQYTYSHTVAPNVPPSIIVSSPTVSQPPGFTMMNPFSISSPSWAASNLVISISSYPTNFIDPRSIFLTLNNDGFSGFVVYTPRQGVSGQATPIVVGVTDPLDDHSASEIKLSVTPKNDPPIALGSGLALAINLAPQTLQYAANFGGTPGVGFGSSGTLEAWVYATALPDPQANFVFHVGQPPGDTRGMSIVVRADGSPVLLNGFSNLLIATNASAKLPLNQWHHLAGVIDGQAASLYVDGKLVASGTLPQVPTVVEGPTCVGFETLGGANRHWCGYLDELRAWNYAKNATEIFNNYNRAVRPDTTGLVRYYRCEEGFAPFQGGAGGSGAPNDWSAHLIDSSIYQVHLALGNYPSFAPGVPLVTRLDIDQNLPVSFGVVSAISSNAMGGTVGFARELFFGPNTPTLNNGLLASPGWPTTPDVTLPNAVALEVPPGGIYGFGERLAGYLLAPQTGAYTFAIASINESQLYLSPGSTTNGMTMIASSPASGVSFHQFDAFPSQQSSPINLAAGQLYYFEVRRQVQTSGSVSPHLSVQWTLPGGKVESPIPAWRIRPPGPAPTTPIALTTVNAPSWGQLALNNGVVTYQPSSNYFGIDTMTFSAKQGSASSVPVVVEVNVTNRNPNPIAGSGGALSLGGQPAAVESYDTLDMSGQSFTVEAWARRFDTSTDLQAIFSFLSDPSTNRPGATLGWFPGGLVGLQITNLLPKADLQSSTPYTDTGWHHYAAVFDATTGHQEIFRDGISLGSNTVASATLGGGRIYLGSVGGTSGFFKGAIDEFRLWTRARSRAEILDTKDRPLVGNENDLRVYYRFDEGNGLTAYDATSASASTVHFDARIVNPASWISTVPTNFATLDIPENSPGQSVFLPATSLGRATLTYRITGPPQNGTLTADPLVPGRYLYKPQHLFSGSDRIRYTVTANGLVSQEAVLNLNVLKIPIPPILSFVRDQELEEEDPSLVVSFNALDEEVPNGSRLTFIARSSNATLMPVNQIVFGGSGTNRTITLTPVDGEVGSTVIEVDVSNTEKVATLSFNFRVNPRLVYAVVNVGETTKQPSSYATAINASGQIAGYAMATTNPVSGNALFYTGYGNAPKSYLIRTLGGSTGTGLAVNGAGVVVGASADAQGGQSAFATDPVREPSPTSLGLLSGGTVSVATGINDAGLIVGYAQVGDGTYRAFSATQVPPALTALALPTNAVSMWATAVNRPGEIAGHLRRTSDGSTNAFLSVNGQFQDLGRPPGADHVTVQGINDEGLVVGTALYATGAASRVAVYQDGQWRDLGDMFGAGRAESSGVNRFGQIVGRALTNGVWHAFIYTDGRSFDLNELARGSQWTLVGASGINDNAQIAVNGTDSEGLNQALLLYPATEVGRRVFRPEGTLALQPVIEILPPDAGVVLPTDAFFWGSVERKLYAIRPTVARIRWHTGTYETLTNLTQFGDGTYIRQTFTNEVYVDTLSFNVWPNDPKIHVAGAPVQLQPDVPGFRYHFVDKSYSNSEGSTVDDAKKVFNNDTPGYTVFHYLRTEGRPVKSDFQTNYFTVARTVRWDDLDVPATNALVTNVVWNVGSPITNALHQDYPGLNGYVLFTNVCYDGTGPGAAYNGETRQGPILPVNKNTADQKFVVVWYRQDERGVAWPSMPYAYDLKWPDDASTLVIASGLGSGLLLPSQYPDMRIYHQDDDQLPGYNPNEEHALIIANTVYALRNDLNAVVKPPASDPYVLLKYHDPASGEWRMKVFGVVAEDNTYQFRYDAVAGREIQPPLPISVLPIMSATNRASGSAWKDYNGRIYARSAQANGPEDTITVQYFYPLQAGFFYDLNRDGVPEAIEGQAMPWLDLRPGGNAGDPVEVQYSVQWPADAPVLQVGQSLTTAQDGLPDITDMASAQVVFDSLDPDGTNPRNAAVRLYDPLTPRSVSTANFQFPASIKRTVDPSTGNEIFPDLPYYLRVRLYHDAGNRLLVFRGFLLTPAPGANPITLVNVMTEREMETIRGLDPTGDNAFRDLLQALYRKTRNPNQVDLSGDGVPDESLLVGLTTAVVTNSTSGVVSTNVVRENLQGPKALAFGLPLLPPNPIGLNALQFTGPSQGMTTTHHYTNLTGSFTMELWVRPADGLVRAGTHKETSGTAGFGQPYAVHPEQGHDLSGSADYVGVGLSVGTNGVGVFEHGDSRIYSPLVYSADLSGWHHYAIVYSNSTPALYIDGVAVATGLKGSSVPIPSTALVRLSSSAQGYGNFSGSIAEFRVWNYPRSATAIQANFSASLTGTEAGLVGLWKFSESSGASVADASPGDNVGSLVGAPTWVTSGLTVDPSAAFAVVAENDNASLGGLPVGLHVISLTNTLARGALAVIESDNVLDERVTLRHSADFGGQPENFAFEWYYQVDGASADPNQPAFDPTQLPLVNEAGDITDARNWIAFPVEPASGTGVNDITIGTGQQSSLLTLSDTWYVMRYGTRDAQGQVHWSGWIGDPAGTPQAPRAMFVPGWVKRVTSGINLFAQRSSDFGNYAPNTLASALASAGPRYQGDVALNPTVLDNFGLIEIYTTVLNRARNLSIDGNPAVAFEPADKALLGAAGNLADLYLLHANEAFADASDPTIGLTTDSTSLGSLASSVFAFQNQAGSLLDEELGLLRGRDDRLAGVNAYPVYNRLFWNFTGRDGEAAYVAAYGIPDQNGDGFVNAADARILYPQGHGDAWGHYLTALTGYYDLLRHTNFIWHPRPENTLVAGVAIEVSYQDERRFAGIAAARARTGAEIVDRTYRLNYSEDPLQALIGGVDTDQHRAWGVIDWARRTAQASYFDWVTGNAILPAVDTNLTHTGIQKVDRTTVTDLMQIVTETEAAVKVLDRSDAGFNPLGFDRGVVPFDVDPDQLRTSSGTRTTHFEQIYERAVQALQNAESAFNRASSLSAELRKQQNSVSDFSVAVAGQEASYLNDLIEIYGYPYQSDLGPSGAYPSDYTGPDITHWMYVDELDAAATDLRPEAEWADVQQSFRLLAGKWKWVLSSNADQRLNPSPTDLMVEVDYPVSAKDYAFKAPASWGKRRAEGRLQTQLRALVLAQAQVRQAVTRYQNMAEEIESKIDLLDLRYAYKSDRSAKNFEKAATFGTLDSLMAAFKIGMVLSKTTGQTLDEAFQALEKAIPGVEGLAFDIGAPIKASVYIAKTFATAVPSKIAVAAQIADLALQPTKEALGFKFDADLSKLDADFEKAQYLKELGVAFQDEAPLRLDIYNANRTLLQAARDLEATIAEGNRVLVARTVFRQVTAGTIQADRYRDLGLRVFQNDALQKYDSQFQLAANYVHLAAAAYDYELNLGDGTSAGSSFGAQIAAERNLGELVAGQPVVSRVGLASILGRMRQNFNVQKGQLGLNNDRAEKSRFSLRSELFRALPATTTNSPADSKWRQILQDSVVSNLWDVAEFRRYCRPFASESSGPQPGIVLRFGTTITSGQNFFDQLLGPLDSSYDPSEFATRIRSVAVWFTGYDAVNLAAKPRVYLVPVGTDRMRSSNGDDFVVRDWQVLDQRIPVPFPLTDADLSDLSGFPVYPSVDGSFTPIRRHSAFRAYQDSTFDLDQFNESTRLVGRSAWNSQWVLIIPGAYMSSEANPGLTTFIQSVSDIKLYFQTYSVSGN